MIHIVHFVPSVNYTSGIMSMIMNYYRRLDSKKFKFYFIYFLNHREKNYIDEVSTLGGDCYKISSPTNYFEFKRELKGVLNKINNSIEAEDKKIFHNHQISFTILIYNLVRKFFTKNIIVHNHLTKYSDKTLSAIRNYFLCIPIKYMNLHYFACSKDATKIIFGKKNKVIVINNGIDVNKYLYSIKNRENKRNELKLQDDDYVIGTIGRLEPQKNYFMVLSIFMEILKKNEKSKLIIIGRGYLRDDIEKFINKNDIFNKVQILEDRKDIPELLSAMDIFLFPSKFEGLGIAAVEAESSGLPTFISDKVPQDVKIVNCKSLSLNDSAQKWADEIINTNNNIDRKKSNSIVQNSNFNINANIKYLEQLYFNIAK